MPKDILIFADGTGQIGGLHPDQRLSNIYKMYRAMRPGPSSPISYRDQIAYYDPGLGAGETEGVTGSKIRNLLESALGAGIEDNMIDCYAKIIAYYEDGDRVSLFGFSRGAYTVRALANLMNLCGVPTQLEDGSPMPRSGEAVRRIATEAVKSVYGHGTGKPRDQQPYLAQREEKGRRFRVKYGSQENGLPDDKRGNVEPHFIGVFDTVAALQSPTLFWLIVSAFFAFLAAFVAGVSLGWATWLITLLGGFVSLGLAFYLRNLLDQIRFFEPDPEAPLKLWNPFDWPKIWRNTHRAYWRKEHYDSWLSPKVRYARHALAIDEERADFPRVDWGAHTAIAANGDREHGWLRQEWFAGCHSDVGGSYSEDESRLSDISLRWMIDELNKCAPTITVREDLLQTTPDPMGVQHAEVWMGGKFLRKRWKLKPRIVDHEFDLHATVKDRLGATMVPHPDANKPYRPRQLADHPQAAAFYREE